VIWAMLCEQWSCSYDELISRHTYGQILLLGLGRGYLERERNQQMQQAQRKVQRDAKRGRSKPRSTVKPPKPFKDMTGEEYMDWVSRQGRGII